MGNIWVNGLNSDIKYYVKIQFFFLSLFPPPLVRALARISRNKYSLQKIKYFYYLVRL